MKLALSIAVCAFALCGCMTQAPPPVKTTAASEDPVICRAPHSRVRPGVHLKAPPVCQKASKWAQIEERARPQGVPY